MRWYETATYAVEDLCLHGTYVEPLRQEIQAHLPTQEGCPIDLERLVQLDSFIKESIRCSNVDASECNPTNDQLCRIIAFFSADESYR